MLSSESSSLHCHSISLSVQISDSRENHLWALFKYQVSNIDDIRSLYNFSQMSIFFDVFDVMKHNGLSQMRNDYPLLAGLQHDLAGVTWIVAMNNYEPWSWW